VLEGISPFRLARSQKLLLLASLAMALLFLASLPASFAATTYHVKVGGQVTGVPFAKGVVWFNGFNPSSIVIHPGDTVVFDVVGGVHTVTSSETNSTGGFVYDSSPKFTPAGALSDMAPGGLLAPGSVFSLDTSNLPVGHYTFFCKIHPGMSGTLDVTNAPTSGGEVVNAVAGYGDVTFAAQVFAPNNLTVEKGTIIRWTLLNPTEPHTITGANSSGKIAWDSSPKFNPPGPPPVLLPGQSFTWTYNQVGTFTYFCKVHAYLIGSSWVGMVGIVHVIPYGPADVSAVSYGALALAVIALALALISMFRKK